MSLPTVSEQAPTLPDSTRSGSEGRRRSRRAAAVFRWLLLASFVLSLYLGQLAFRRPPPMNYTAFEPDSANPAARVVAGVKPRDVLVPATMKLPHPAPPADEADRALREGSPNAARVLYHEALQQSERDAYSRAMLTCLLIDRREIERAIETFAPLRRQCGAFRSVRLLETLLWVLETEGSISLADAWLDTLAACSRDGEFERLHNVDRLADSIDERLHDRAAPGPAPRGLDLHAQVLALSGPSPSRGVATDVLTRDDVPLALKILALGALRDDPDANVRAEVTEALAWLSTIEPENAYWDYLLIAQASPHLFLPGSSSDDDQRGPSRDSVDLAIGALRKDGLDTHAAEVHALLLEAERRRARPFAELRTPLPGELVFLGDRYFVKRLVEAARLGAPLGGRSFEPLAAAAQRLLDAGQQLHADPFGGFEEDRRRLIETLWTAARANGLDPPGIGTPLEQRNRSARLPFTLRAMQRYALRPLPIPGLVREFRELYAADPEAVASELERRAR